MKMSLMIDDYEELVMIGMAKLKHVEKKSSSSNVPNTSPTRTAVSLRVEKPVTNRMSYGMV
jgi:hypothetical protein